MQAIVTIGAIGGTPNGHKIQSAWLDQEVVQCGYYYDRLTAGLDASGKIVGRTYRVTGPSILARWAPPAFKDGGITQG